MVDTFIPVVQVECNQIGLPSRHEQGIPRFINRTSQAMVPPGVQVNIPQSVTVNGYQNTVPGQNTSLVAQQNIAYQMMPHLPPASVSVSIQQPHSYQGFEQCQTPRSPSLSSTVSSMSVYEDCVSIPSTSPRQQPDPFFYQSFPTHSFDPSGDQPKHNLFTVKSVSSTSIPSDAESNGNKQWTSHQTGPTSAIKPEQAMAMVNEKLRDRIAALEKKIHNALAEVTFLGDRNWRLEAHVDSLMHTLEVLGVTDIEDLTGKTLPLPMFRVKVKAGYRLGPFNRLPRRAVWSYDEDCKTPPNIDFSSDRAKTLKADEGKSCTDDDLNLPAGSDIGLSVRQMFHYERQIEELREENHTLSAKVAEFAERETSFQKNVKNVQDQYAELQNECEDTKEELNCAVMRLHNYDGSCPMPTSHPHGEDMGDHVINSSSLSSSSYNSHPDYDYHHGREASRVGPYYRRSRDEGGIRDGRRYRNVRGR